MLLFCHRNERASRDRVAVAERPVASEVSISQGQRRQSIHDELDAGVIESVRILRGLVADTDAPPGARVRAATALMD
jgi:hypothetical protein